MLYGVQWTLYLRLSIYRLSFPQHAAVFTAISEDCLQFIVLLPLLLLLELVFTA